jgi:hypothetical protein
MKRLTLRALPGTFAVCRLEPRAPIPDWASGGEFLSITRTVDELSIICPQACVPASVKHEPDWRCFHLDGPIPFTDVGVLESLLQPLAAAGIGVVAVSTFDTDYVLVKEESEAAVRKALIGAGHYFAE